MNIALVCNDGISIMLFCKGIIRALRSIPGAQVMVVCDAGPYREQIETLGVTCASIPIHRWMNPLEDLKYLWRLWRLFRHRQCDVVLNFATKPNIFGTIAAKLAGARLILSHIVGLGAAFAPRQDMAGRLLRRTVTALYRLVCTWSSKVWFTNGGDLRYFLERGLVNEDKSVLSRNYLDVSDYDPCTVCAERMTAARLACKLGPTDQVVIMVARMIWAKGIREFAEAAELLRESHPSLKFLLVAPLEPGSRDAVPEAYVREKERGGNFLWLGFQEDVKRLYAIADIAVLPTYYKEGGYPRALLEPMAMGKPLVATNSEDCRGTVEEGRNGFLVPARDSRALAEAIARVITDPSLLERFGQYSRRKALRDFDERSIVPDTLRRMGLPVPDGQ